LLAEIGLLLRRALGPGARRALLVTNPTVRALYGCQVETALANSRFEVICAELGDGERYKNLAGVESIIGTALAGSLERGEPVVALGGGVVGDLGGLVAALYLRGTPVVQVPTTLLAQIDSSIGGKVGVNHRAAKNSIGAFHQPLLVCTDPSTLSTLPERELRAGLYEAVKYGVMADARLFRWLEQNVGTLSTGDTEHLTELAYRCCRIKARIVAADETETGLRRVLNLGHTVGHALETATGYRRFRHGEAVGYGLEAAAELAVSLGLLRPSDSSRIRALVSAIGPRPGLERVSRLALLAALQRDKKRREDEVPFILPLAIGSVTTEFSVPAPQLHRALDAIGIESDTTGN
jgi:3-dehydroquinate synthase